MPCNYLACFSDTSLHFLLVSKIITAVVCQAEDHFQKLSIKPWRPSPYCLPTELERATPTPLCKSPWESQAAVLALWSHMFLARVFDHILNLLLFFCMTPVSHYFFKSSLRCRHIRETCRKHVRIFKFHINFKLMILKSSGENIHKPSRHIFLIFIFLV